MDTSTGIDIRLAKALSHPVRAKALVILNERTASPSDIAQILGLPIANVSYHVNTLLRLGCVEEVDLRYVRGSIEHFYRATRRPWATFEDMEGMPANARQQWFADAAAGAFEDARAALIAGTFGNRPDTHASWTRLRLDEQGWSEVYEVLNTALQRCIEIHERCADRLDAEESAEAEVNAMMSILFYESEPRPRH